MGFLPICDWANTTEWMHHPDITKMDAEKAWWELKKEYIYIYTHTCIHKHQTYYSQAQGYDYEVLNEKLITNAS